MCRFPQAFRNCANHIRYERTHSSQEPRSKLQHYANILCSNSVALATRSMNCNSSINHHPNTTCRNTSKPRITKCQNRHDQNIDDDKIQEAIEHQHRADKNSKQIDDDQYYSHSSYHNHKYKYNKYLSEYDDDYKHHHHTSTIPFEVHTRTTTEFT
jgi:hypothetical protein